MAELDRLYVRILGDITDLQKNLSKAERRLEQFGYDMAQAGKALTAGLTVPLAAAGVAATKLASDAAEAANKFDVVFGASADRARQRIEELHATIPLTTHEMEGLSASLQDMLVPMGLARSEAADLSIQFLELAGDIASFNNISTEEALNALRSGLAGESEPLRRYGVDVREARLESLALTQGLIEQGAELDRTARAQAVFAAVTADSRDAIGDAARTADEAANSFRFFWRNVKELGVTIGNELLPVVTPLVNRLNDLIASAGGLQSGMVQWAIAIGAVTAAVGPLLFVLGKLIQTLVVLKPALVGVAATLGVSTGGLALIVGGAVTALGFLASAFVKSKLEAAAMADEVKGVNAQLREFSAAAAQMSMQQVSSSLDSLVRQRDQLDLPIDIKEALGDPEKDILPLRMALARVNEQILTVQRRYVELQGLEPVEPVTQLKDDSKAAAENVRTLAEVWKAAFGELPRGDFTPVPDMGLGGSGSVFQGNDPKKEVDEVAKATDRLEQSVTNVVFAFSDSFVSAIRGARDAFQAFVDQVINQLLRLAAQFVVFQGLKAAFPGSGFVQALGQTLGFVSAGTASAATGAATEVSSARLDLTGMPPATNPLASTRDAQWLDFLARSNAELGYSGA